MIEAKNNSNKNVYIRSTTLNGKTYTKNYITYQDIIEGGTLFLEMDDKPNMYRGIGQGDRPFSVSTSNK